MSLGDLIFATAIVIVFRIADRLEENPGRNYACPSYCDVDHICYIEQDTIKTKGEIDELDSRQLDTMLGNILDVGEDSENHTY